MGIYRSTDEDGLKVPPTGFEPVLPAPEADALSTELRGHGTEENDTTTVVLEQTTFLIRQGKRILIRTPK